MLPLLCKQQSRPPERHIPGAGEVEINYLFPIRRENFGGEGIYWRAGDLRFGEKRF
jgi:hypothetical protein